MSKGAPATNPTKRMAELDKAISNAIAEAEAHANKYKLEFILHTAWFVHMKVS